MVSNLNAQFKIVADDDLNVFNFNKKMWLEFHENFCQADNL